MKNFSEQLRKARRAAGMTQAQASMRGGWKSLSAGQSIWSQYESGKIEPSLSQAQRLCWAVDTTLAELLAGE